MPTLQKMCPFFIVSSVPRTVAFYCNQLGFSVTHQAPAPEPFFAIVHRDEAMLFLKSGKAAPLPNPTRDADMRWDAYILVDDPDALAVEYLARATVLSAPLANSLDGLRGFEITDPDGYVLFFGRPQ